LCFWDSLLSAPKVPVIGRSDTGLCIGFLVFLPAGGAPWSAWVSRSSYREVDRD
jgi:hypothetical protein